MSKLYKIIAVMCIAALLLCGCLSSGRLGNGADPSGPTGSTPTPTDGPDTLPWTETPTAPPAPTTEPTEDPTDCYDDVNVDELIAAAVEWAAEWIQATDYRAEVRKDEFDTYHVILDGEKYLYDILFWGDNETVCQAYCTPKAGTVYPNGPALPPADMTEEEFRNTYTILDDLLTDRGGVQVKMAEVDIGIACPLPDALDGAVVQTADGKTVFCHHGRLYIWEGENVFRDIGYLVITMDGRLNYGLIDGAYVLTFNFEHAELMVIYRHSGALWPRATLWYDTNGATSVRLEVINFDRAEVKCVQITEEGEVEVLPYDTYFPFDK